MLAGMRLLHVADRLSDRGGSYGWTTGVVEALACDHEVRLVVGRDDGGPRRAATSTSGRAWTGAAPTRSRWTTWSPPSDPTWSISTTS